MRTKAYMAFSKLLQIKKKLFRFLMTLKSSQVIHLQYNVHKHKVCVLHFKHFSKFVNFNLESHEILFIVPSSNKQM